MHTDLAFARRFVDNHHPLVARFKQVGTDMWTLDILHIVDLNGVSAHAISNLLCDIIRDRELGRSRDATLEFLNEHLSAYYERIGETDKMGEHRWKSQLDVSPHDPGVLNFTTISSRFYIL